MIERVNATLINKLRCLYDDNGQRVSWDKLLPIATNMYNDTVHSTTQFAPKFLLLGIGSDHYLVTARQQALKNIENSHNYNKQIYDKQHKNIEFSVGDLVFVKNHYRKKLDRD